MEKRPNPRIQPFVAACRHALEERRTPGFPPALSRAGAPIHPGAPGPAKGATIPVAVRVRRQATHVRLPATVRWSKPSDRGGFVFGVSFDGIESEEQKILDCVSEGVRRRAHQLA